MSDITIEGVKHIVHPCAFCEANATRVLVFGVQVAVAHESPLHLPGRVEPKAFNVATVQVPLCDDCKPAGFRTVGGEIMQLEEKLVQPATAGDLAKVAR